MTDMDRKRQWYYRGSLKSCNYTCGYCPFSKKQETLRQLRQDKEALLRFTRQFQKRGLGGAVLIAPYGEALIHDYYWEALGALSGNPRVEAAGAQSNFSFPVDQMLDIYHRHGGDLKKLRLWGPFHPEMSSVEQFTATCRRLSDRGVLYCAGAVGVPDHLDVLWQARRELPEDVYFWINKMDGPGRRYTQEEIYAFTQIDPYFDLELMHHRADGRLCGDNRFVEADGAMRRCNLSRAVVGNFYDPDCGESATDGQPPAEDRACGRKRCGCYLAYCNRRQERLLFFQPYPAFRIPVYPKAVFMDIDGTLVPEGHKQIPKQYVRQLTRLARYTRLYAATSLPPEAARIKIREIWPLLAGGVFAGGARCIIRGESGMDEAYPLETSWISQAEEKARRHGYSVHVYKKGDCVYKVTLAGRRQWKKADKQKTDQNACEKAGDKYVNEEIPDRGRSQVLSAAGGEEERLRGIFGIPDSCQILREESCIQITKKGAGKLQGVLRICEKMGYGRKETAVFGNSANDRLLLSYFPLSVAARGSSKAVREAAGYYFEE